MHIFQYRLKKPLDGNAKIRKKKNVCAHLSRINFLSDKKKCTYLWWKHIYQINSSMRIGKVMWWDNLTNQRTDLVLSIYVVMVILKSLVKVFLYNCLTRLRSQTAASASESNDSIYCLVFSLWGASNLCHIWKLLYSLASPSFLSNI